MKRTLSLSSLLVVLGSLLVLSSCNRDKKTTLQLHGLVLSSYMVLPT